MSQDDTLRLAAEVVDRWSGPMRDMQRALMRMQSEVKSAHKQGTTQAKKQREAVLDLDKSFDKLGGMLKTSVVPTMAAMGVTVLTVGGAFEALKDTVLGFGAATRQLSFLSRETGMTINQLRAFEALGRRLGTTPDAMAAGAQRFAQHMHDLRNLVPAELNAWKLTQNAQLNNFVSSISHLPLGDALSKAVGELSAIPDQQEKRRYLRMLGLPEKLADVPVSQLRQIMADVRKNIGTLDPDAEKKALKFETAINRLQEAIDHLKVDLGARLAPAFTKVTEAIDKFVTANQHELVDTLKGVAQWVEHVDWNAVAGGIGSVAHRIGDLARQLKDLKAIAEEIGGMWVGRMLLGVPGMVGGALWNAPHPKALDQAPSVPNWLRRGYDWMVPHSSGWAPSQGLMQKESFSPGGGNGLFQPAAFTVGGGNDPAAVIAKGTRDGMLEALREWQAYTEGDQSSGGGTGGFGSGGGFHLTGYEPNGGFSGARGGTGAPALSGPAAAKQIQGALAGPANAPSQSGSSSDGYVAAQRARFAKELSDPNKRLQFAAMLLSEGTAEPTAESAMNRSLYAHTSLMQMLRSGFYGPINRGQLPAYMARLRANPRLMARMNGAIDRALRGADTIHGATDQGMFSDPNGRWMGGRTIIGRQVFNDWGGGPGGHAGAARWRRRFEAGAALHQHWSTDEIMHALGASYRHEVKGSASVHVRLDGLPRGARTSTKADGVFGSVTLHRGRTMAPAAQGD